MSVLKQQTVMTGSQLAEFFQETIAVYQKFADREFLVDIENVFHPLYNEREEEIGLFARKFVLSIDVSSPSIRNAVPKFPYGQAEHDQRA